MAFERKVAGWKTVGTQGHEYFHMPVYSIGCRIRQHCTQGYEGLVTHKEDPGKEAQDRDGRLYRVP